MQLNDLIFSAATITPITQNPVRQIHYLTWHWAHNSLAVLLATPPQVPTKIHEHVHTQAFICTHCRLNPGVWVKACNRQHLENMSPHIHLEAILACQSLWEGDKTAILLLSDMTRMFLRTIYQQNNAIRCLGIINIFVISKWSQCHCAKQIPPYSCNATAFGLQDIRLYSNIMR